MRRSRRWWRRDWLAVMAGYQVCTAARPAACRRTGLHTPKPTSLSVWASSPQSTLLALVRAAAPGPKKPPSQAHFTPAVRHTACLASFGFHACVSSKVCLDMRVASIQVPRQLVLACTVKALARGMRNAMPHLCCEQDHRLCAARALCAPFNPAVHPPGTRTLQWGARNHRCSRQRTAWLISSRPFHPRGRLRTQHCTTSHCLYSTCVL